MDFDLNEYMIPLAVAGTALLATFFYFKSAMNVEPLKKAPKEEAKPKKKGGKKKVDAKTKQAKKEPALVVDVVEEASEQSETDAPVEAAKPATSGKKTGAQKRAIKKARMEAELENAAKPKSKAAKNPTATQKQAPKKAAPPQQPQVDDDQWEPVKDAPKAGQKGSKNEAAAENSTKNKSQQQKESKAAAKKRAEDQRNKARSDDYLKGLPEEVIMQMKRFNNYEGGEATASPTKSTEQADDAWTTTAEPKKPKIVKKQIIEAVDEIPVIPVPIVRVAKQVFYEMPSDCWGSAEAKDTKTKLVGLEECW